MQIILFSGFWSTGINAQANINYENELTALGHAENVEVMNNSKGDINLEFSATPLKKAVEDLAKIMELSLTYSESIFEKDDLITISIRNKNFYEAIELLLKDSSLSYAVTSKGDLIIHDKAVLKAETGIIRGKVTDSEGAAMPGVNITIKVQSRLIGTSTDADGNYELKNVPVGTHSVVAQFVGFQSITERITIEDGELEIIDFEMSEGTLQMDEVVITGVAEGFSSQKIPYTVGRISSGEITTVPTTGDALSSLQGNIAGVNVTRPDGQPGTDASILLRTPTSVNTSNGPLIVVDGVILGESTIDLESIDIESMEVIKGAAAASFYGSRANSGVIQITTKRGKGIELNGIQVDYRGEIGFSQLPKKLPITNSHAYLMHEGEEPYTDENDVTVQPGDFVDTDGNRISFYETSEQRVADPDGVMDNPYTNETYDNLESFFRPNSFITQNVSLGQRFENTNYYASLNYYNEQGALAENNGFQRYNGRLNLDHYFGDLASVSVTLYHNRGTQDNLAVTTPIYSLINTPPDLNLGKTDEHGNYLAVPDTSYGRVNPIWFEKVQRNETERTRTMGNINMTVSPFKWMQLQGDYSYDNSNNLGQIFMPQGVLQELGFEDGGVGRRSRLTYNNSGSIAQNANVRMMLYNNWEKLDSRLTFQGSMERSNRESNSVTGYDFIVAGVKNLSSATERQINSSSSEIRANSWLANLDLDYDDKYIGSFLIRRDGSSLFGSLERWHYYYRGAFAYRMSNEEWWPLKETLTEFKPRYAIGTAGGRPTFAMQYETWNVNLSGDGESVQFNRGTLGNRNLTPEHTTEQDIGLDFIIKNRVKVNLSYVTQVTDGQILREPQRAATGYEYQWANLGQMSGTTYEATIEAAIINNSDFTWRSKFIVDHSKSEITEWNRSSYRDGYRMYGEGHSLSEIWGLQFVESMNDIDQARIPAEFHDQFQINDDGYLVFVGEGNSWQEGFEKDLWGTTGVVDGRTYRWGHPIVVKDETGEPEYLQIGDGAPDVSLGFVNTFNYKNLMLYTHLRAQIGGNVFNAAKQIMYQGYHGDLDQAGKDPENKKPLNYYQDGLYQNFAYTSHLVEDGSFLKLQAIKAEYKITGEWMQGLLGGAGYYPRSVSLGVTGRNLLTISGYSGFDPEVGTYTSRIDTRSRYPQMRQFTFSFRIDF